MLEPSCENGSDIFKIFKNMRHADNKLPSSIDSIDTNIPEHFASIYKEFYSRVNDSSALTVIMNEMNDRVDVLQNNFVDLITPMVVKNTTLKIENNKSYPFIILFRIVL